MANVSGSGWIPTTLALPSEAPTPDTYLSPPRQEGHRPAYTVVTHFCRDGQSMHHVFTTCTTAPGMMQVDHVS
jgi:hypothetical protein